MKIRREVLKGSAAVATLSMGGSALSAGAAVHDPAFADLLAALDAAKAAEAERWPAFTAAEARRFAVAAEQGREAGDAEWNKLGGPDLEAEKEAAEFVTLAAEDAIRDYPVKSLADLGAKVRTMQAPFLEEESEALIRDILALAEG